MIDRMELAVRYMKAGLSFEHSWARAGVELELELELDELEDDAASWSARRSWPPRGVTRGPVGPPIAGTSDPEA